MPGRVRGGCAGRLSEQDRAGEPGRASSWSTAKCGTAKSRAGSRAPPCSIPPIWLRGAGQGKARHAALRMLESGGRVGAEGSARALALLWRESGCGGVLEQFWGCRGPGEAMGMCPCPQHGAGSSTVGRRRLAAALCLTQPHILLATGSLTPFCFLFISPGQEAADF